MFLRAAYHFKIVTMKKNTKTRRMNKKFQQAIQSCKIEPKLTKNRLSIEKSES